MDRPDASETEPTPGAAPADRTPTGPPGAGDAADANGAGEADGAPAPWPVLGSEPGPSLRIFRSRFDRVRNPRNGHELNALVLETPHWCNVVARRTDGRFVLVRQWRFAVERVTLEVPGGMIEAGEAPRHAAERELREETGHVAGRWTSLGSVSPNPAIHDNRLHLFLAEDCEAVGDVQLDAGEDVQVVTLDEAELRAAIRDGEFDHALALCALGRVLDLRGEGAP